MDVLDSTIIVASTPFHRVGPQSLQESSIAAHTVGDVWPSSFEPGGQEHEV